MNEAWAKDEDGNVIVFPLVGYETMVVASQALALRLPFMLPADAKNAPTGSVQLILTAAGARELAADILAAVEKIKPANG